MPRIPDNLLDCSLYIYPSEEAARRGLRAGGSGFLVAIQGERMESLWFWYAVTNSHVIKEANALFIRLNTHDGRFAIIRTEYDQWVHHPQGDDLAITEIGLNPDLMKFRFVPVNMFVSKETVIDYGIGVGDDVFMVGRFINHEGRQKNLPSVRFGNISIMPIEPMIHQRGTLQESFVVEMRSIGGFSGSPVFLIIPTNVPRNAPKLNSVTLGQNSLIFLLGVDWGHISDVYEVSRVTVEKKLIRDNEYAVVANTSMAGVVPAWKIMDLLNLGQFIANRRLHEERIRDRTAAISDTPVEIDTIVNETQLADEMYVTREDFEEIVHGNDLPFAEGRSDEEKTELSE